jgi:hypothetical protein
MSQVIELRPHYKPLKDGSWHVRTPFKVEDDYVHYLQDTEENPKEEFLVPIRSWRLWARNTMRDEETGPYLSRKLQERRDQRTWEAHKKGLSCPTK